jgi:2-polyprenyl-3-methyl-5-hydroxy-6-metoxy-1,4-benzoquinol methylase
MAERQMATCWEEVKRDHVVRYQFAVAELRRRGLTGRIVDAGAGVGYGSALLAEAVKEVVALEISTEARELYERHWRRTNIHFHQGDLLAFESDARFDAVVCFEFIEHIEFYDLAIGKFAQWSDFLIISTPNELVRPYKQPPINPFHVRHFTPAELTGALARHGFAIHAWHCQSSGAAPDLKEGTQGKFMIAVAEREAAAMGRRSDAA